MSCGGEQKFLTRCCHLGPTTNLVGIPILPHGAWILCTSFLAYPSVAEQGLNFSRRSHACVHVCDRVYADVKVEGRGWWGSWGSWHNSNDPTNSFELYYQLIPLNSCILGQRLMWGHTSRWPLQMSPKARIRDCDRKQQYHMRWFETEISYGGSLVKSPCQNIGWDTLDYYSCGLLL